MKKNITSAVLFSIVSSALSQENAGQGEIVQQDSVDARIQIYSTPGGDMESEADQQDLSGLLQSSRDVFTQAAAFQFGAARYRQRGYIAENHLVMVNGIPFADPETGYATWSSWGGLNDVTRLVESRPGIGSNRYAFSGAGGYTNIDAKASVFRKGTRASYAFGNRFFRHRLMLTHATGITPQGWALAFSASARTGDEVYIPGTYFRSFAFYVSAEKNIGRHRAGFTAFAAPTEQGRASAAQKEAYELAGDHYYNSAWGYQSGRVRNASVSRQRRPVLMLHNSYRRSEHERLTASLFFTFGRSGITGLNRYDAPNPKPDYYRYLPGYYYLRHDTVNGDLLKEAWNKESTRQINWERMISMNQNNLYTEPHLAGQVINTGETRARYILENRVEDLRHGGLSLLYNRRIRRTFLSAGVNAGTYVNRKFKVAEDLLGASFWLDVDQFAEDLGVEESIRQNDIENPNRKVKTGDRFGYDYAMHARKAEVWAQAEHSYRRIDLYYALNVSAAQVWREGFMANGKFPLSSKGEGEKTAFLNGGVKSGLTFKLSGRQFVVANAAWLSRQPEALHLYVSPRVRHDLVGGVTNEDVLSGDLNYQLRYPTLRCRISLYHTVISNQVWLRTYWHDTYNTNVNLIMTGVDQVHQGLELGLEKSIHGAHVFQLAAGYGSFRYAGRPQLEAWQDNNSAALFSQRTVYLKNFHLGGSPSRIVSLGYKYNGRKHWFAVLNFNLAGGIYLEPNPDRRTGEATEKYLDSERALAEQIIAQEKLPSFFFINLFCGKSFRLHRRYFANVYLSVNNLLNNTGILSSGYEQLRWDPALINAFPPKYYYMPGAGYLLMMNFNF